MTAKMAMTSSERSKRSRARLKEQLGEEGLRQLDHERYLLKKKRANLKFWASFQNRFRYYFLFRECWKEMHADFFAGMENPSPKQKHAFEKLVMNIVRLMYARDIREKLGLNELPVKLSIFPELDASFFHNVAVTLRGEDREVWKYLFLMLIGTDCVFFGSVNSMLEDFTRHTACAPKTVSETLDKLKTMLIIEQSDNSTKPGHIKRGPAWGEAEYDLSEQVRTELLYALSEQEKARKAEQKRANKEGESLEKGKCHD